MTRRSPNSAISCPPSAKIRNGVSIRTWRYVSAVGICGFRYRNTPARLRTAPHTAVQTNHIMVTNLVRDREFMVSLILLRCYLQYRTLSCDPYGIFLRLPDCPDDQTGI